MAPGQPPRRLTVSYLHYKQLKKPVFVGEKPCGAPKRHPYGQAAGLFPRNLAGGKEI